MIFLTAIRRNDRMRRLGKALEKKAKAGLYTLAARNRLAPRPVSVETLDGVERILLVRPNFRLGNALISARLIEAFANGRPDITVDYLGTDTTQSLFKGMPLGRYHALSRSMLLRPWRLVVLWSALRRRHYDLVIQVADSSFTGWLCTQLAGARQSVGKRGKLASSYHWVMNEPCRHAYDLPASIATPLHLPCKAAPWLQIEADERARAAHRLTNIPGRGATPVGVFIGGHLDKRLPLAFWQALFTALNARRLPFLVLAGPEEQDACRALTPHLGDWGTAAPLMPLREFAACISLLPRLITPDTGPMHMAAALGIPVIALLSVPMSQRFAPRDARDTVLLYPTAAEVAECACPKHVRVS
jgi:heptosyltransferase-3